MFGNFIVFANMLTDNQLSKTDTTCASELTAVTCSAQLHVFSSERNIGYTNKRRKGEKKKSAKVTESRIIVNSKSVQCHLAQFIFSVNNVTSNI